MSDEAGSVLTRARFAQAPIALLEACAERKGFLFVYLWLWHYAGRDDAAWPSVERLAAECHMAVRDVRLALRWLVDEGWVRREERPGKTTVFHVRLENPSPKKATPPPNDPSPKRGRAPLPQKGQGTPPPFGTPNKRTEQEDRTRGHSPSVAPPSPKPVKARAADAAPTDRGKGSKVFRPKPADVPAELAGVQAELLAFWAEKAGSRSQRAWLVLLTELGKIQCHIDGGTQVVREQLAAGTQAGWASCTFTNWLAYGQKRQRGITPRGCRADEKTIAELAAEMDAMPILSFNQR